MSQAEPSLYKDRKTGDIYPVIRVGAHDRIIIKDGVRVPIKYNQLVKTHVLVKKSVNRTFTKQWRNK